MARAWKSGDAASADPTTQAEGAVQHPSASTQPKSKAKASPKGKVGKKNASGGKKAAATKKSARKAKTKGSRKQSRDVQQHSHEPRGAPNFAYMGRSPVAVLPPTNLKPVRVYWDAENIPFCPKWHAAVLQSVAGFGRVTAVEVFASAQVATDLTGPPKHGFRPPGATLHTILDSGVNPKNKTDMTLALEALAAVFHHPDSLFLIVSDDKDFEPLVLKLQSRGAVVAVATKRGRVTCSYTAVADHWIDLHASKTSRDGTLLSDVDADPLTNEAGPSTAAAEWFAMRSEPSHRAPPVQPVRGGIRGAAVPAAGRVTFAPPPDGEGGPAVHPEIPFPPPPQSGDMQTGRTDHHAGTSQPAASQGEEPSGQQQSQVPSGRKRKRGTEVHDDAAQDAVHPRKAAKKASTKQKPTTTKNPALRKAIHDPRRRNAHVPTPQPPPTEEPPRALADTTPHAPAGSGRVTRSGRAYGQWAS